MKKLIFLLLLGVMVSFPALALAESMQGQGGYGAEESGVTNPVQPSTESAPEMSTPPAPEVEKIPPAEEPGSEKGLDWPGED